MATVFERVKTELVESKVFCDPDEVVESTRLVEDLNLDDLDIAELLDDICVEFHVEITPKESKRFHRVRDIINCLKRKGVIDDSVEMPIPASG
jgi:acyl carrier protein